jgi:hypothetical protein
MLRVLTGQDLFDQVRPVSDPLVRRPSRRGLAAWSLPDRSEKACTRRGVVLAESDPAWSVRRFERLACGAGELAG